ncbi:MAG: hypothetical protein L0H94_08895 [Nitrospira sp.]|nr:hypothetical protein [Nitrospira sp.]
MRGTSSVARFAYVAVAVWALSLGQFAAPISSSWAEVTTSLIVPDLPTGRVSAVGQEEIVIDGQRHRLSPRVSVKWDAGGPASLQDIRPGDLVQFIVKDLQIVLLLIVQPG